MYCDTTLFSYYSCEQLRTICNSMSGETISDAPIISEVYLCSAKCSIYKMMSTRARRTRRGIVGDQTGIEQLAFVGEPFERILIVVRRQT